MNKSPGLIRRLSRGAHNRLRRRASTTHANRIRDQSAGPVLVRRRSDSNGASDFGQDMSDLDLNHSGPEDVAEEPSYLPGSADRVNGLGISVGRLSNASSFEGGIAPTISSILEQGTILTKVTPRKRKQFRIRLDSLTARVCWHPSNPSKAFFIDDVRDIRVGVDTRNQREDIQVNDDEERRLLTILYDVPERSKGRTIKIMHLIMPNYYILHLWTDALNVVTRERIEIMNALAASQEKSERSMAMAWKHAMNRKGLDADHFFTLDDARWLCRKLEINCSDSAIRTHFTRADTERSGLLNYARYQDFVNSFKERKDVQNLYRNLQFGTDLEMNLDAFLDFLKKFQGIKDDKDRSYWEGVFDKYSRNPSMNISSSEISPVIGSRTMSMQAFRNFLSSSYNSPLDAGKLDASLDKPLNEYFISSSHNTYLLGRQVAGASSVEGYISALVKGCRCVEIDCWDGEDGRPLVTHGRTMTTKILFSDCVSVIAKYAFHSSPYPLIISLEVHCNPEQQETMVDLMKKHFGDMLVLQPITNNTTSLPSPEELKNKILIKVKAAEEVDHNQLVVDVSNGRSRTRSLSTPFSRATSSDRIMTSSPLIGSPASTSPSEKTVGAVSTPRGSTTSGNATSPASSAEDSDDAPASSEKAKRSKTSRIIPALGELGVYLRGIKYSDFSSKEARTYNHTYSFAENTFNRLCIKDADTKTLLEKHNNRFLMRVYPGARRIDSSNFNPLQAWRRGVQMAALNWQTYDVHFQVNEAMFTAGKDRCGYVLKPDELRHAKHLPIADTIGDTQEKKEKKGKKIVKFAVDIISAQRLPRPRNHNPEFGMNPYIEFEMYSAEDKARGIARGEGGTDASARDGSSGIGSPLRKRTNIVEGNGFDPIFNQTITMTVETKYPSLIFVRWTVWNSADGRKSSSNNALLATFTAKLSSLQQGYRHLPLFNPHGEQYRDAKLFVKIKKEAPVAMQPDESAYGYIDPANPRPEPVRADRSWPRRIFSRNPSERRRREQYSGDLMGSFSRTSSMER